MVLAIRPSGDTYEQLRHFVGSPRLRAHLATFVRPFDQLLARFSGFTYHGGYMLAEEVLSGHQVTLEGFVQRGVMRVVGIVDSLMYRDTLSFKRLNTYEVLFAVAAGTEPPALRRHARFRAATSYVLRSFRDATVETAPDPAKILAIQERFPVTLFTTSYRSGQRLSEVDYESDGYSYRYAVVNVAGIDRATLERDLRAVRRRLGYRLATIES